MRKTLQVLILLLSLLLVCGVYAGQKATALNEDTSPTSTDLAYTVDDPSGTPTSKKATWANIITKAHGLGNYKVLYTNGSGVITSLSLGADDTFLLSTGASGALEMRVLAAGDMPASIDATKIGDGTVTSGEFQYVGDVTGLIQAQINAKLTTADIGAAYDTEAEFDTLFSNKLSVADIDDTPVDAETAQPISSNYMYDHITDANQHPEYMTPAEHTTAVGADYDTEAELLALFAAKADESIVGTSLNADDLELDGAILQTAAEIPHTDVAETVTAAWALHLSRLTALTAEPTDEVVGDVLRADGGTWDPCGLGSANDYFVLCTAAGAPGTYVALFDITGDFKFSTIQAAMKVIPDADGIILTAAQMNAIIVMTGAGDVDIPADQCDTATGKWLTVKSTAAHLNSVTSNDAADLFVLSDGTALDAQDELDLAGAAGNQVTVVCLEANKWYVTGEVGTCVDGGVAD